jgi:hypothetical protein
MSSVRIAALMERLRIQCILKRLIKAQGREQALETVLDAIRLEFPASINTINETPGKRNIQGTAARHQL